MTRRRLKMRNHTHSKKCFVSHRHTKGCKCCYNLKKPKTSKRRRMKGG